MEETHPPEHRPPPEEEIRALGFDPAFLTPAEQRELLEIHQDCPDELLEVHS